ncbi:hypothetical protein G7077_00540 [Sphingomonas piscis]|uniref:Uncharacterized protein n=1 Tax=Sphingomonas piscis TaxID=2714943 RepID=A0A6G7YLK9_9SPHN|nr:hypothetical protein [Sphingomonas piscis]QIK77629.1 hypothetical protein G7077_00540 [Sphingomonas piscis]
MMPQDNDLPEGTDTIINGASETGNTRLDDSGSDALIVDTTTGSNPTGTGGPVADAPTSTGSWGDKLRDGRQQFSGQASEKVQGLVGQGLERSSEALGNVSRMIGDTAAGIDERLGQEYGDYARRAAQAIEDAANSLASKQPEELIDDARNFVRKSPGVALAGAAVLGFALTRLVKNGLPSASGDNDDEPRRTTSAD